MNSKAASSRKRVVVAVGSDAPDPLALSAAARLARSLGAELAALFVEDVNLLRLAELPFAFEIGPSSATARRLVASEVERTFRNRAAELRTALAETAGELQISLTFETARGRPARVLLEASTDNDLVVLAASSGLFLSRAPAASIVREALRSVLLSAKSDHARPVAAVLHSIDTMPQVLSAACGLARATASDLVVFAEEGDEGHGNVGSAATAWLDEHGAAARILDLEAPTPEHIASLIAGAGPAALFWARDDALQYSAEIETLLETVGCPVILVR